MRAIMTRWIVPVLCWLCLSGMVRAHTMQVEPVVVQLRPQESFITAQFSGNGEDIIQAVKVQDSERVGNDEFVPAVQERLEKYFDEHLTLKQGGQKLTAKIVTLEYWRPDNLDYTKSKFESIVRYERDAKLADGAFEVTNRLFDYLPNAQMILSVAGIQKTLNPGDTVPFDPKDVRGNLARNIRDFTLMGIEHIFTGPDHMLFILALLLTATGFWPLAKTLTGFTFAHSITLILSALSIVLLPDCAAARCAGRYSDRAVNHLRGLGKHLLEERAKASRLGRGRVWPDSRLRLFLYSARHRFARRRFGVVLVVLQSGRRDRASGVVRDGLSAHAARQKEVRAQRAVWRHGMAQSRANPVVGRGRRRRLLDAATCHRCVSGDGELQSTLELS